MRQGRRDDPHESTLIHNLNQRYRSEFDRAERLQAELNHIHGSRLWPWFRKLQHLQQWLRARTPRPFSQTSTQPAIPDSWSIPFQPIPIQKYSPRDVSIIIPFRDQFELLERCVIPLHRTVPQSELVLVDNGSTEPRMKNFLNRCRVNHHAQVVHLDEPFNFSRLCNAGASVVHRPLLLFLNNDIHAIQPSWLDSMLEVANDPRVGIVGATLLYPNRTLQHVGMAPLGPDDAWIHPYRHQPETIPGIENELRCIRTVPAVTGACLLIRREVFESLGGFDPQYAITMNDVDLCQRVKARQLEVVMTPFARLWHYESMSRGYQNEAA